MTAQKATAALPVTSGTEEQRNKGTTSDQSQVELPSREKQHVPLVTFGGASVAALEHLWNADDDGSFDCPIPGHVGRASLGVPPDDERREIRLLCCRGRW